MLLTSSKRKTKIERVDELVRVTRIDQGRSGMMAWETPYIVFTSMMSGREYIWHSASCAIAHAELKEGQQIGLEAFVKDGRLRRVSASTSSTTYGMGGR